MIVVVTGAPGAGKGTQCELLSEQCGYRKVSTGDALRKHVKLGTVIGKKAAAYIERGELVPDDVLFEVLKEELGQDSKETILLDGYPRNIAQAQTLDNVMKSIHPVKAAIHLDVDREELIARLSGRRVCSACGATYHLSSSPSKVLGVCDRCGSKDVVQRNDDKPESVAVRLDVYEKNTRPVLDYYRERNLYRRIKGSGPTEEIFREIKGYICSL